MTSLLLRASAILLLCGAPLQAQKPAAPPKPARVSLQTSEGTIVVELATKQAPITSANFLAYVDQKKFDGTAFYRAANTKNARGTGFIQGGIRHSYVRMLPPIAHEPTSKTGLRHVDGTISMARNAPGSAMGDFFITVGRAASMDANPAKSGDNLGFAAFGKVVKGMDVVKKILAAPTVPNAGSGGMRGQILAKPIRIIAARRAPPGK